MSSAWVKKWESVSLRDLKEHQNSWRKSGSKTKIVKRKGYGVLYVGGKLKKRSK